MTGTGVAPPVGPQYVGEVITGEDESHLEVNEHSHRWIYKDNVQIAVAHGLDYHHGEELSFPGLGEFPDRRIFGQFTGVLFNGQVVCRKLMLSVDGHRALLPCPEISTADHFRNPSQPPPMIDSISEDEVALAKLIDQLSGGTDFDSYMERSGIVVVPTHDAGDE